VIAVPADSAQNAADALIGAGVKIIFNYSEALLDVPSDVNVHTSNPAPLSSTRSTSIWRRRVERDAHVRIPLWHGYLIGGTANVYTRQLARE
jgi:hypothetical protein